MKFELIIFDCDGVLVDSERIAVTVFKKILFEECGLDISQKDLAYMFMGQTSSETLNIIEKLYGDKPPPQIEKRYKEAISQELRTLVKPIKGIETALNRVSLPYCLASGGSHEKIQNTLGKTNLLNNFEGKIFSTADVTRGKPFPDVFLYAAKMMGCKNIDRCLVIEDSPIGVRGAYNAGMIVFGFSDLIDKISLIDAGAHHVFNDMSRLHEEIANYERSHK